VADVKWEIDVDAKAGKAKEAGSVLERLEKTLLRIDGHTAMLAGHFAEVGERGKGAGEKVHGVFGDILSERVFEKIAEGAKMVVEGIIEIGKEAIKAASAEQRMKRVFEANAGGNKELGEQNKEWTDILAKQTEFNEAQTEGAFLDLKRVGATDQEARLAEKAAADIAAVSKNKDEAFQSTIEAFARLQRTGVVSNRTLAPLGLGVKDFKQLDSMKKRMEEGKVDKGDLFNLIMSRTNEKAIGERAANNADLLGNKLAKLSELPERFYKKLADTSAIKTLTTALDGVLTKLDPDSPTGRKISGFLEGAFTEVADAVKEIDFDAVADTLTDDVLPALKTVVSWIKPFVDGVERILRGFHEMHDIAFGPTPKNKALDDFDKKQKAAEEAARREEEPTFLEKGKDVGGGAKAWHGKFHTVGEASGKGMAEGIADGSPKAETATEGMADRVDKKARKRLGVQSPSVVFEDIGAMTAAGFVQGVEGGHGDVDRSVEKMFDFGGRGGAVGGARGDINITLETHINLAHGDGTEQGARAADAFNMKVQAQMISALEQAAIEAGLL
jgi:hypothetical protein